MRSAYKNLVLASAAAWLAAAAGLAQERGLQTEPDDPFAPVEALPDDLKKVIDDNSGRELSGLFGWTQEHYDGPARQLAVDRGNDIVRLDAEATAAWKEASQPVIDGWIEEMNGRGLDGTALVDEARALIAKYTQGQ